MPAPLDLTGQTFGSLRVLGRGPRVHFGREQQGWLCRCSCSAQLVVPQDRLPHKEWIARQRGRPVTACPACRGVPCVICGGNVPLTGAGHGRRATCSDACAEAHRRSRQRAGWHRRVQRDPALSLRMADRKRQRAASDPEYAARVRAWEAGKQARHRARMQADPQYAERVRARARALYARHAERIGAERRARLDAMSPAELQDWCARARRYTREWRRRHLAELKKDPEAYQRYRQIQNEYHRRYHQLQSGPPPERHCIVCGTAFVTRQYRVLCFDPECLMAYQRDVAYRAKARQAQTEFLRLERALNDTMKRAEQGQETCPDRL